MKLHTNQYEALEELHVYYLHKESGKLLVLDSYERVNSDTTIATFVEYKDKNQWFLYKDHKEYKGVIQYQAEIDLLEFQSDNNSMTVIETDDLSVTGVSEFGQELDAHNLGKSTLIPLFTKKYKELVEHIDDAPLPY
jgi:hypothetical protein